MPDEFEAGTDLLELLETDHQRIRRLLTEGDGRTLVRELSIHLVAEAHLLYAEARRHVADGDALVDELLDVDHRLEEALVDLDKARGEDARARVDELALAHIDQQERRLFPAVADAVDRHRLAALGDVLGEVMREAPTHPHPRLPDEGSLAIIADAFAARYDELRDAYRDGRDEA